MPGTGSVYRVRLTRPDGTTTLRWVAQTSVGPRGGRHVRRRYAPRADNTRRAAKAILDAMLAEEAPSSPSMTAGDYLRGWIDRYVQRPKVGASQAANARGIVTHHLLPVLADVRLADVRPSTVEAVIARTAAARSPSTVRHVYDVLSVAFADAERDNLIAANPVRRVDRPSVPRTDRRPWTLAEDRMSTIWDYVRRVSDTQDIEDALKRTSRVKVSPSAWAEMKRRYPVGDGTSVFSPFATPIDIDPDVPDGFAYANGVLLDYRVPDVALSPTLSPSVGTSGSERGKRA